MAKAVERTLSGDSAALRICIDRLIRPPKRRITRSRCRRSLADKGRIVIDALGVEKLSPEEAGTILQALATQAGIVEGDELEKRIAALEKRSGRYPPLWRYDRGCIQF